MAEGVKITEQDPAIRGQLGALRDPAPVGVKLTLPAGVVAPELEISLTVAVHVEGSFTTTVFPEQVTTVVVACLGTVTEIVT